MCVFVCVSVCALNLEMYRLLNTVALTLEEEKLYISCHLIWQQISCHATFFGCRRLRLEAGLPMQHDEIMIKISFRTFIGDNSIWHLVFLDERNIKGKNFAPSVDDFAHGNFVPKINVTHKPSALSSDCLE